MKTSTRQEGNTQCHESWTPWRFPSSFILCFDPAYNTNRLAKRRVVLRLPALISKYTFLISLPVVKSGGEVAIFLLSGPDKVISKPKTVMMNMLAALWTYMLDSYKCKECCSPVSRSHAWGQVGVTPEQNTLETFKSLYTKGETKREKRQNNNKKTVLRLMGGLGIMVEMSWDQ